MHSFSIKKPMQAVSFDLLRYGILLSCALLISALLMLVWAGVHTAETRLLYEYADYTVSMALAVMGAGLFGSLLLEDILRHNT
ncbi:MAG: hypothetical protein LIO58_00445 [Oscillospiraceae bacterium]|nr:hypothetical protein [Oscillospiraceae bacterium]